MLHWSIRTASTAMLAQGHVSQFVLLETVLCKYDISPQLICFAIFLWHWEGVLNIVLALLPGLEASGDLRLPPAECFERIAL